MYTFSLADNGVGVVEWLLILVILTGIILLLIGTLNFHNKKVRPLLLVAILLISVGTVILLQPKASIVLDKQSLEVQSPWFTSPDLHVVYEQLTYHEITAMSSLEGMRPTARTNGYSSGTVRQGWFRTADNRKAFLLTQNDVALILVTRDGQILMLSPDDAPTFFTRFTELFQEFSDQRQQ